MYSFISMTKKIFLFLAIISFITFNVQANLHRVTTIGRSLAAQKSTKPECQDVKVEGNAAKVTEAGGDVTLNELKKQRLERVKCNLDCMLKTKSDDWVGYVNSFPQGIFAFIPLFVICFLTFFVGSVADVVADVAGKNVDMAACASAVALCLKKSGPYTTGQSSLVVILYLAFALATFISAIVGLASGTGFGVSLVKTACQFDSTRISANIILGRVLDPAKAVNRDMDKILKDVDDETARALAARDGRLTEDAQKVLIASLEDVSKEAIKVADKTCGYSPPFTLSPPLTINIDTKYWKNGNYSCEICAFKKEHPAKEALDELDSATGEIAQQVETDRVTVNEYIVLAGSTIKDVVKSFTDGMQSVVDFVDEDGEWDQMGQEGITGASTAKAYAPIAAGVPFSVLIVGIVLTIIGVVFMRLHPGKRTDKCNVVKCAGSYCVGFSWCSTCLSILITFLVLQILWPFIFIVADVCIVLDNVPKSVTSYVPMDDYSASMLQSCFDNTTVLPPGAEGEGNSTGGLDFASKVGFGSASKPLSEVDADLDDMFNWSWLDEELSYVNKMGLNLTRSPKSCAGSSNATQCTCLNERTEAIFKIKDMYENIIKEKAIFKDYMGISIRSMYTIKNVTKPMFNIGDTMKAGFQCGEVGEEYYAMTGILCGDMLASISNLVSAWTSAALFGMVLAYLGLKINQRYGGHGWHPASDGGDEEGFEMTINDDFKKV